MVEGSIASIPLRQVPPERQSSGRDLLAQGSGALIWGTFFCVVPIAEGLIFGSVLWIPFLVWRERGRAAKYGFLKGFLLRSAIVGLVVTLAILLPTKYEDGVVIEGLPGATVTFRELAKHRRIAFPESLAGQTITLPSARPTLRQVVRAIEARGDLECSLTRCGTGATLLGGSGVMGVEVQKRN